MSYLEINQVSALELIPDITKSENKDDNKKEIVENPNLYDMYLSEQEKQTLTYLNNKSLSLRKEKYDNKNIENMSIKKIFSNWANVTNLIIEECIEHINQLFNYEMSENEQWYTKFIIFFKNVMETITEKDRLLYFGISIVILGILTNFIIVSS